MGERSDWPTQAVVENELDFISNAARNLRADIQELDRWWPPSKRGSNAQRIVKRMIERLAVVETCVSDARSALAGASND